jgi:polyhydroxybutyrate depolymerase
LSVNQITDYWINYNLTDTNPLVSDVSNTNTTDGSTVQRKIWSNGQGGVEVQELKIIGGEHEWPGTSGNMDINANNEIWQFLSKFDKNGMIDNLNFEDFHSDITVTPNPFNDYLIIEGINNNLIELYDLHGRKAQYRFNNNIFDTESLKRGVYILVLKGKNISFKLVKF